MQPFLDKLAKHLYSIHGDNFSRICLVFPSRRAGLFFKQYVSRIIEKPIWLPDIYALEDFVVHKSGLTLSDPLDLIARLYKVYKSIEKEKAQSFSEFISWGNMLLGDFDEIDQYMADGEKVFQYLDEIKAMKHWNPDGKPLTAFEQNYLQFYNSLAPCYTQFREELLKHGEGYFGLAFDQLLQSIENKSFDEWDSIVFAGFNALTSAEEKLLKYLIEAGKAEIYWDVDDYYLSSPHQEAGRFLREYQSKKTFGELNWIDNSLSTKGKSVSVIGVPGNVGQAKLAGELIRDLIRKKGTSDGIALVLVDEGLLLPVLNSIPTETGDFNVTMGFPLKQTPVFSLINIVLSMFANAKRFSQPSKETETGAYPLLRFYHKDIQRILSHPFIVAAQKSNGVDRGENKNASVARSFYTPADLYLLLNTINRPVSEVFKPFLDKPHIEPVEVINLIRNLISYLSNAFSPDERDGNENKVSVHPIELEYLFYAAVLCSKLDVILKDTELKPDIETVQSMVSSLIAGIRLPFYGEPLNGLQVMGMLETRLLDFTDIIMISVNEGLLPRGKHQTTFIPDDVRSQFGMQRYNERTAVFAYHFYRLMQRAENAWLIYNTEGDELGGGEKSRFISQLLYEMPTINPEFKIIEQTLSVIPGNTDAGEISIVKTKEVIARLHQIAERGLSPTALAMYLKCKLQFYFSQVLHISEPEQVSETIDAATLGEIVHDALHKTYLMRKYSFITPEVLSAMVPTAIQQVHEAFNLKFKTDELSTGKNLLIVKVAGNMVKRFLLAEKRYLEQNGGSIEIVMLEENLESFVEIADAGSGEVFRVKLHGKADRIDRVGGVTRIIDYKTGKVENKDLKLDLISNFQIKDDPGKLLQVLAYALMYSDMQTVPPGQLVSGIISLRKSSSYLIKTDIDKSDSIDKELLAAFKIELESIIGSIYDSSEPFSQTENRDACNICAFNTICNRTVN
ncbi:MAG: PD-(D/E)XK nuclease family protein [Lentimicrobiaceae bacterium]|jgi:RecB family exonuclease